MLQQQEPCKKPSTELREELLPKRSFSSAFPLGVPCPSSYCVHGSLEEENCIQRYLRVLLKTRISKPGSPLCPSVLNTARGRLRGAKPSAQPRQEQRCNHHGALCFATISLHDFG